MNFLSYSGYNYLLKSYLSFAHFDDFNNQSSMNRRKRLSINLTIQLILIVNTIKIAAVVANQWIPNLKFYLLDLFLFDERHQKVLDIGLIIVQLGLYLSVSYWTRLNTKVRVLQCFDFLFVSNRDDVFKFYKRRYNLGRRSTNKFLSIYRLFYALLIPTLIVYGLFVVGLITRCLYFSYKTVSCTYFLAVVLLLYAITVTTYMVADVFVITKLFTVFLSTEFMLIRAKSIDKLVFYKFILKRKANQPVSIQNPVRLHKQEPGTFKVLRALYDFAEQFASMNSVLDASLSRIILGIYLGLLGRWESQLMKKFTNRSL